MQRLYIIRHGETEFNKLNIVQGGGIDSDLNETGLAQAKMFFDFYKTVPFDAVYCSQLKRTYQTIQSFETFYPITKLLGLNELGWGTVEGKEASDEIREIFVKTLHEWKNGNINHSIEGGESPQFVWERAKFALESILNLHPKGNILICTHGRTIRVILSMMLGYGLENMHLFEHTNTALNLLEHVGNFQFRAIKLNDASHLEL